MTCEHHNFHADVDVHRLEDTKQFMAAIRIRCVDCDLPFEFLGLEPGLDLQGARVSIDGQEANIAITPKGVKPNPLQRMSYGIRSLS